MPVPVVERYELGRSQTGDRLEAADTFLGEELREALGAIGFLFTRCEFLADQNLVASVAREALSVPRRALVSYSTLVDHSVALDASLGVLLLVAVDADSLLVTWDERLDSDWLPTDLAAEALLVERLSFELVLLHTSSKDVGAGVAAQCEVVVMAIRAVGLLVLRGERLVDQGDLAVGALEAVLVPVLVLVRQILEVGADDLLAFLAPVGEQLLVALDAERLLVAQNVAEPGEIQRAVEAGQRRPDVDRYGGALHRCHLVLCLSKYADVVSRKLRSAIHS